MLEGSLAFLAAFVLCSLVEYAIHRLMHLRWFLGKKHAEHHRDGWGQGFLGEFFDYLIGFPVVGWVGFLYSVEAGIGFAAGCLVYAVLAAYAHQLQHDRPELVFWMPRPVHYLHHKNHAWHNDFGILLDVWDRVFGTYKVYEWKPERRPRDFPLRAFFQIKWY
jgi:sterol desaturase/sphingolipid hydroxylase (fatty acid hydroxylase superfamily)